MTPTRNPAIDVAFALVSGGFGGGQAVALAVARRLHDGGLRLAVISPDDGPSIDAFRALGARVMIVGPIRSYDVALYRRLRASLHDCRTLYTHTVPVHEAMLGLAAKAAGAKVVLHRHSLSRFSGNLLISRWQSLLWKRALKSSDHVIAVAPHIADDVRGSAPQVMVIPNGVPIPEEPHLQNRDRISVGYVGRIDPNKRVEDFLEAAAIVTKHRKDVSFRVVGASLAGSDYEQQCRMRADRLALDQGIFAGGLAHGRALEGIDVMVLPSQIEGHALSVLEAMASGRIVIASDIPGCRESIRDGDDGILVPVANPQAIAAAITRLAGDPPERERLAAAARARAINDFSESRMVEEILKVIG